MKIGVISNFYPPFVVGGYELLCSRVCEEMVAFGHEVSVLTGSFGPPSKDPPGQAVSRKLTLLANEDDIYRPFQADAAEIAEIGKHNRKALEQFVTAHKPDVLFGWNLYFLDSAFAQDLSTFGIPVVLFVTDNWLIAQEHPDKIGDFFRRFVFGNEVFEPSAVPAPDERKQQTVLFGAEFVRALYHHCGMSFAREVVVHNGVQLPMVPPELMIERSTNRDPDVVSLLFAGRVVDIKGVELIIAAMPIIKQKIKTKVTLTIVGDTQDKAFLEKLQTQIKAFECEDNVSFRKPVSEKLLLPLFNDHDIYLFPSLYEPFSLTLIHALGAGIPTIASNVGGNPEIVKDGKTGLIFDRRSPESLAEAVVRLVQDPGLRSDLSQRGQHVAQRFTFRRMIKRIEAELMRAV